MVCLGGGCVVSQQSKQVEVKKLGRSNNDNNDNQSLRDFAITEMNANSSTRRNIRRNLRVFEVSADFGQDVSCDFTPRFT